MKDTPRVGVRWPTARVTRGADDVAIDLDLAGFAPDELDVEAAGSDVTIRGHGANGLERHFELRLRLPPEADADRLRAWIDQGELEIRAPLRRPARRHRVGLERRERLVHAAATPS
jgi:HSP20 family molecular chaperone IbpA